MPLKLDSISQQMESMTHEIVALAPAQQQFLEQAQTLLHTINADALRQKLEWQRLQQLRIPWLVATPLGSLSKTTPAPALPSDFCVIGSDASSIPPDRHSSLHYYVLNVGYALLSYGSQPDAVLEAYSQLCFRDEDLYVFPERRDVPVEGMLLGARMEVESLHVLQRAIQEHALRKARPAQNGEQGNGKPTLALRDGPLILWTLQNESEAVQQALLHDFLRVMDFLKRTKVPLGGYISFSDGRDVANSLRVWLCPALAERYSQGQPYVCEHCDSEERELCQALAKIRDRDLFSFLAEGERSELFSSASQILKQYGEHCIHFFYLNVGGEVARIEVPQWVGRDAALLSLLHGAVYDQCRRSPGFPPYPPVLLEAHEQAVISAAERQLIQEMVEQSLAQQGQHIVRSAKDDSKRRRGI